jgi:3-hydroxyacyl-[acyl-carrier-protein] dehydratase
MRFTLVDRVLEMEPGRRIRTIKSVSLAEEYLDDHFPRFPVLPGVLMLEALTQTCAWLVRATDDFAHSIVTLREARNVKYARFVRPGESLEMEAELKKRSDQTATFEVQGLVGGALAVSAKLTLEHYNLAERRPDMAQTDVELKDRLRDQLAVRWRPGEAAAAGS